MFDMRRREFITLLGGASIFWPTLAHAQLRLPRVGYLTPRPLSFDEEFRRGGNARLSRPRNYRITTTGNPKLGKRAQALRPRRDETQSRHCERL
jgi:hypothetical protein